MLCCGSGVELDLPLAFKLSLNCTGVLFFLRVLKSPGPSEGSQSIVYSLQWHWLRIHINYELFLMCLHLAMTLLLCHCDSVHRPASKGSHTVRAADLGPTGWLCSRLLMTSWALGRDIGRDSPFHVGLHTHYTKQLINLNLKLPSHVVRQCQSGAWNVAGTSSR